MEWRLWIDVGLLHAMRSVAGATVGSGQSIIRSSRRMPGCGLSFEVQHPGEDLGWGAEVQTLSRGMVVGLSDTGDLVWGDVVEVGVPGQEAADPADGVLDAALLPGGVGIAEEGIEADAVVL